MKANTLVLKTECEFNSQENDLPLDHEQQYKEHF